MLFGGSDWIDGLRENIKVHKLKKMLFNMNIKNHYGIDRHFEGC